MYRKSGAGNNEQSGYHTPVKRINLVSIQKSDPFEYQILFH